ncbi:MAG: SLC13 family permease [Syntrophomonadaceae bacterium]|nr:SLC13 family permease [Syntrophomonadaceae bacterium]
MLALAEREAIKYWALVKQSVLVVAVTVCGFLVHQYVGLEPATVALAGASLLLLVSRAQPEEILLGVEWPTIFFFTGLFILVGGLEQAGIIAAAAREALQVSGGNLAASAVLVLWFSALASAFVDNIPFVATMIPLLKSMGQMGGVPLEPLWWSLALGACLGGNGTLVGASANVVVAGLSEKRGRRITFAEYFRVGFPAMLLSMALCTGYVYLVYLR